MAEDKTRESPLPPGARRDSRIFMALLAVTVLLYLMSIPLGFGVIVTGPAAAVFGLRALHRASGIENITSFRWAMVAGVVVSGFAAIMGLVLIMFREPVQELQDCLSRAITQSAQTACQREYREGIEVVIEDTLARVGVTQP